METIVFDDTQILTTEILCKIKRFEFLETTIYNSGTLQIDPGCPSPPDISLACRTIKVPLDVIRDGYFPEYPVLTYQWKIYDHGDSLLTISG